MNVPVLVKDAKQVTVVTVLVKIAHAQTAIVN